MKEIELLIGDLEDGLSAMGIVKYPAIEEDFYYDKNKFDNKKNNYSLASNLEIEKGMITGPALIPEKRIYRYDKKTNEEYYVYFTEETIRQLSIDFLVKNNQNVIMEEHKKETDDIFLVYSWIVENEQDAIITKYGFKNIPVGTWVCSYKIFNEDIKDKIRKGEINGFSIEGYFTEKFSKKVSREEEMILKLKELLKDF